MTSKLVPLPSPVRLGCRGVYTLVFNGVVALSGSTPTTVYGWPPRSEGVPQNAPVRSEHIAPQPVAQNGGVGSA